ncbi:major facilitator superfamily domain-containing protein [Aspergillus avenaceus]|uniref:Major facilitator superfamily domain-containing protein n=1 Tax=Aspergillus avenaceus TaxID=36643 RepID=A0A5N6TX93_ASPAV|nr:major facilitator superfamily domain-containing protein [Aspergillus avenaceus]
MSPQFEHAGPPKEGEIAVSPTASDISNHIVDWDGDDDPANPMNWSKARKITIIALVSFASCNDAVASSLFAPSVPGIMEEFHETNPAISPFLISVHTIGFATGPVFFSPLSEIYGRCPILYASNVLSFVAAILCAVSVDIPMLAIARIILGFAGSVPFVLGGGVIADMIPLERRGRSIALLSTGTLLHVLTDWAGPVLGGYMALGAGWRWTFWLATITIGCCTVLSFVLLRETYAPVLLKKKAWRLGIAKELINSETTGQALRKAFTRSIKLVFQTPIVAILTVYNGISYAYFYFLITTFPSLYGELYGFNTGEIGLTYLGISAGFLVGQLTIGPFTDWYIKRQKTVHGKAQPEDRLPPMVLGHIALAVGMFWYGWSAQVRTHWIVPILGSVVVSLGIIVNAIVVVAYLVDTFTVYAASAVAINNLFKATFGAFLPMTGPSMYGRLGYGWGNTTLGLIVLVLTPTTLLVMKYGEKIRHRYPVDL